MQRCKTHRHRLPEERRASACAFRALKTKGPSLSTFLSRQQKVGKCVNKAKGVLEKKERRIDHIGRLGISSPLDPGGCIVRLPGLCSVRVSCRCVWLIGAEVRKRGCGHLLIIGWKLLQKHSGEVGGMNGSGRPRVRKISAGNIFIVASSRKCFNAHTFLSRRDVQRGGGGGGRRGLSSARYAF